MSTSSHWYLIDEYQPVFLRTGSETVQVGSEEQLLEILQSYSEKEPRIISLRSPWDSLVSIALGGQLGAVEFLDKPMGRSFTARRKQAYTDNDEYFAIEGQPTRADSESLFPVGELIDIVSSIYRTNRLPDNVDWV